MTRETVALRGPLRKRVSHLWTRDQFDWYVEPEWVSSRLFENEEFIGKIYDPACGLGRILQAARRAAHYVVGSDIVCRCAEASQLDFMQTTMRCDNIISNPPFGISEKFIIHAMNLYDSKIAMLLPANWVQGDKRSRWLATTPLRRVWFLCPRPSMPPGAVIIAGGKVGNGTTDYGWFIWERGYTGRAEIGWLHRDLKLRP